MDFCGFHRHFLDPSTVNFSVHSCSHFGGWLDVGDHCVFLSRNEEMKECHTLASFGGYFEVSEIL